MRFSIIVPVYKVEKYIRRCIDSILKQTYSDFEAIFIIDGSPDNSGAILKEYTTDSRIRIIEKENGGATSARKAGALSAKGEYIVCVDGDDYINDELLQKLDENISETNADMICYGYQTDTDPTVRLNMTKKGMYQQIEEIRKNYLHNFNYKDNNAGSLFYTLWTKAVKKDIFVACQMKVDNQIKNGEDLLLIAWFLSKIKSISVIDYSGYVYCNNEESTTRKRVPYDLINVTNVVREIESVGVIPFDNSYYYYFQAIFTLLHDIAKQSNQFSDFKEIIDTSLSINHSYIDFKFHKQIASSMKLKFWLIKYKKWRLLYYLVRFR